MLNQSLGLIEVKGLTAAIEAADSAVKSADVELIGYELTKGGGWVTVKIQGNVSSVEAAIQAAWAAASRVSEVIAMKVIPRPGEGLEKIIGQPKADAFTEKNASHVIPGKKERHSEAAMAARPAEKGSTEKQAEALKAEPKKETAKKLEVKKEPQKRTGTRKENAQKQAPKKVEATQKAPEKKVDMKKEPHKPEQAGEVQLEFKPAVMVVKPVEIPTAAEDGTKKSDHSE